MKAENFCYWLQSAFELMKAESFDAEQTKIIKNHLAMVFYHEIDPSMGDKEHQGKLNEIHNGPLNLQYEDQVSNTSTHSASHTTVKWEPDSLKKDHLIRC